MFTTLLSPLATRRRFRRLLGPVAGLALVLAATPLVEAQTVYGLGTVSGATSPIGQPLGTQLIGSLNVATGTIDFTAVQIITGVTAGQSLVGMDSRPATGQLFALGYNASAASDNAQLYTLTPATGVATAVGNVFSLGLGGAGERIGFDFNPTVDRIRVVGSYNPAMGQTNNYRLNPTPGVGGAIGVTPDLALNYAGGTPADPGVGAAAYTNSTLGATGTVLYDVDEINGLLARQNPPNDGVLGGGTPAVAPVPVTFNGVGFGTPKAIDIDVYLNPSTGQNQAYLIEVTGGGSSNFYSLNLTTGAATSVGAANVVPAFAQVEVRDIAAAIDRTVPALTGQLAYAVTTNNNILGFDVANPSVVRTLAAITGIAAGQTLVGTDYRPNTGQLFGLGYNPAAGANDRLYTIDPITGVATPVGGADIDLDLGADVNVIGLDFNPTVDRIRVVSANDRNYRLNPNTGGIAFPDLDLKYAAAGPAVPNSSQSPTAGTAAYVNSFVGATATGLYVLDHALGYVSLQNPPNDGVLTTSRLLTGVNPTSGALDALNDFDVFYDGTANVPYLAAVPTGQAVSRFYRLNAFSPTLTTDQVATDLGTIGLASAVRDISVTLATGSTVAATPPALTGRLLYGLAAGNLISFDSGNPNVIRTAVNITGLPATQVLVGSDFRPATGVLYALGYDATASQGQLYTLDLTTGALAAVGALTPYALGAASGIGVDFNPVPDRIRIIGANGNNYRTNPSDGTTILDGATGGALSAAAYTNNDNNSATGTVLYAYDQTTNQVVSFSNPNAGTNAPVGGSGITVNPANGVEFDIYADVTTPATPVNSAFAAAAPSGTTADFLYDVSLTAGTFSSLGRIGSGSNLSGLAAFFTPAPVLPVGFTWTGAVSTDWGTAGNWSTNTVPTAADNVVIPDVANDPVVGNAQQANAVTLNTGATLTLADAGVLSVSGNFTNNAATVTFTGTGNGRVALTGAATQTIGGTLTTFPNLTVGAASATIGGPVAIRRGLVLTGSLTTTGQTLTLLSDAAGTAYVVNSGGAVIGSTTVQRYIDPSLNGGEGYRHYSSPVANSTVADLATAGFAPVVNGAYNTVGNTVTPFPNIFGYDESRVNTSGSPAPQDFDKGFFSPSATTDPLEATRGYTVNIAASAVVDFVGTLNNGSVTATGLTRGAQAESGYHLRGNPFPSPLDWNLMVSNGRLTGVDNALYVFKSSGQYTGSYASYVNGVGTNNGTNVVPLGQGFFVRTSAAGATGALAFTNAERLTTFDATPFQRGTADTRPQLTLTLASATARTQAAVYFEQGATAGFDRAFDAQYLRGSNGLTLATEAGAEALAVNGQPALTGADVLVPLRVVASAAGTYALNVTNLANLPATYRAYLRDALTGAYTDLATTPSLPLNLAANGPAAGRYAVLFTTQNRVLATAPAALARLASVYPNPARGAATLLLPTALRGSQPTAVSVVDNLGRVVLTRTLAAGATETLELPLAALASGVYSVQARTAAGLVVKRLVVE